MSERLESRNGAPDIEDPAKPFTLGSPPGRDFWRKPPVNNFDAPLSVRTISSGSFQSARVRISAEWTRLYDQAGLILLWPSSNSENDYDAWLKTGIEFYNSKANLSTVATAPNSTSDWSLIPLEGNDVTVDIEREKVAEGQPESGSSLWVYLIQGEKRIAVREVTWAFAKDATIQVGVFVARPTKDGDVADDKEVLVANFRDYKLELK